MYDAALLPEKLERIMGGWKMVGKFLKTVELALDGENYDYSSRS